MSSPAQRPWRLVSIHPCGSVVLAVMLAATDTQFAEHLAAGHFVSDDGTLLIRSVKMMNQSMLAGFQVNVHAIGDGANIIVMGNVEALIQNTNTWEQRHRIEHAQILRYEDILRFSELGVIPSMQGMYATSDKNMAQDRLGEVRILGTCAWRKLLDTGVIIANGSDFPVEPGKKADFSLLDQDIFAVEPTENWNTAVSKTWVGGRLVSEAQAQ